jgi:hypothetical protein
MLEAAAAREMVKEASEEDYNSTHQRRSALGRIAATVASVPSGTLA